MKLLSIENNLGFYLGESGQYNPVDKMRVDSINEGMLAKKNTGAMDNDRCVRARGRDE